MTADLTVDTIENPTEEYFRTAYVEKRRPVVIKNAKSQVHQLKWDFEHIRRIAGHCSVPVYDWGDSGPTIADKFVITQMPLEQAVHHATNVTSTATQRYSVCQLPIEAIPPLAEEYQTPRFLEHADTYDRLPGPFSEQRRRALFISFFRGIHWHNGRDAVAQLITGRKRFILYNPKDSRFLYPRKLIKSGLSWFDETEAVFCSEIPFEDGIEAIDNNRFPLYKHATPIVIDLGPGDCLYIPSHWWHFTTAHEPCVVVVEFWDAPIRRWGYPIAWRSLIMKPYRKYLYRRVIRLKKFSRDNRILQRPRPA